MAKLERKGTLLGSISRLTMLELLSISTVVVMH